MKPVTSRPMEAVGRVVVVILLVASLAGYVVSEIRSDRLKARIREQAYTMQPGDIPANGLVFGIQIVGSNDFRLQVARALLLLKLGDLETFSRVTNTIGIVREDSRTVASVTKKPPLVKMSPKTAFYSLTWCVAGLVHEARHIELARRRGETNPIPSIVIYPAKPRGYKDFQRDELDCVALQLRVLKKLGAPPHELESSRFQDGTHFDVNRDGKWDAEDQRLQKW